jgi:hypothetical protein
MPTTTTRSRRIATFLTIAVVAIVVAAVVIALSSG